MPARSIARRLLANARSAHARAPGTRARRWTKTVSAGFFAAYGNALLLLFNPPRASLRCALARSAGVVCEVNGKCFDHGPVDVIAQLVGFRFPKKCPVFFIFQKAPFDFDFVQLIAMSAKKQKTAKTRCAIVTTTIYVRDLG
jgi:hypothetical protein